MTKPPGGAKTSGTGLDSNLAATFSYLGGAITGIIFLLVEKQDRYVRFHAAQSTITFLGVFVAHLILSGLPLFTRVFYWPFILSIIALWAFLMFKAFNGERYKLPYIGEWAEQQVR